MNKSKRKKSSKTVEPLNLVVEPKKRELREEEVREEFKKYFIKLKRKLKLDPSLENVIWLHFKSAGFAKKELFDKGIAHFGYKVG